MRLGRIELPQLVPKTSALSVRLQAQIQGIIIAQMSDLGQQIETIEKEIRETPYHKGTEHHIGKLRARLAKLNDKELETGTKKGGGGGYAVRKEGDATVVLIGPPSAGKSTLINKITNAESKVAPYAFTTVSVIPGMLKYKDAYIQILDVPGLIEGAREGRGRGKEVLSVARAADLLLIMTEVEKAALLPKMAIELEAAGIRIDKTAPNVKVEKKVSGGLIIHTNISQEISKETIKEVAIEFGIKNAEITINEKLTLNRLIDAFSPNRVYLPAIFVINKIDLDSHYNKTDKYAESLRISAERGEGIEDLKEAVWKKLGFIRVYLVRPDEEPGSDNPMIMKKGQTLKNLAEKIGSEFASDKKLARIWNTGARFPGQEVSLSTLVQEGMQVRFA